MSNTSDKMPAPDDPVYYDPTDGTEDDRTPEQRKHDLLVHLHNSYGVVTQACIKANVSRVQYYNYYNNDRIFREQARDIREQIAPEKVESKLYRFIEADDLEAIKFYLKTQGKNRGWVSRKEHTGKDGETLKAQIYLPDNNRDDDE